MGIMVTAEEDLVSAETRRYMHRTLGLLPHDVDRCARVGGHPVHRRLPVEACQRGQGVMTGDEAATDALIDAAIPVCRHAARLGETLSWEWPELSRLWKHEKVEKFRLQTAAQLRPLPRERLTKPRGVPAYWDSSIN